MDPQIKILLAINLFVIVLVLWQLKKKEPNWYCPGLTITVRKGMGISFAECKSQMRTIAKITGMKVECIIDKDLTFICYPHTLDIVEHKDNHK